MAKAFVFPGQGAQVVGMGKALADAYPAARAVFDEVDAALGEKLSALIWEGDQDTLTLTRNAQPALMATSMAAMRALEAEGVKITDAAFVAGHSLGGLIAQIVAARTHHAGLVAACPAPLGLAGTNPTTVRIALSGRQSRPATKPVYPPGWDLFRGGVANAQPETTAR